MTKDISSSRVTVRPRNVKVPLSLLGENFEVLEELAHASLVFSPFIEIEAVVDVQDQNAPQNVIDHEHEDARNCTKFIPAAVCDGILGHLVPIARCYW